MATSAALAYRRFTSSSLTFRLNSLLPPPIPSISSSVSGSLTDASSHEHWRDFKLNNDADLSLNAETAGPQETCAKRITKLLKIFLPHVGLILLLLSYIAIGASIFIWLESDNELQTRKLKLHKILDVYGLIMNATIELCDSQNSSSDLETHVRPLLSALSRVHEYDDRFTLNGQLWTDNEDQLVSKWTFAAAVLYALTVITSTGYDYVTPSTDSGRIFTVFFGLIGIPLMFITAADIGKFLSCIVIRSYGKLLQLMAWTAAVAEAARDYLRNEEDDSIDSRKSRVIKPVSELDEEDDEDRLQLPIASYFALILGYCAIGSLIFNIFEKGPIWSFMHGLFFSFNTITTIGLGNIYIHNEMYLALVIAYVVIGLAVITASLDLCSSTLKKTFTKLHYFGRKIRGARRGFATMSDDIREAMRIIAALKKTRPGKERVTVEDLKRYLAVQEHLLRQPYVPTNVHIFRWIEDAYAQYFDETAMLSDKNKMQAPDSCFF